MDQISIDTLGTEDRDAEEFVDMINYHADEGFISVEEGEDGEVRLWPEADDADIPFS